MCGSDTKGRYRFDRVATNTAADESRSTCEANAARATSWPTTRLIRRLRGVVAFIVGVITLELYNYTNVWDFQRATTVFRHRPRAADKSE